MTNHRTAASRGPRRDRLGIALRDLADRVRRLEGRQSATVGRWRLDTTADGGLVAVDTSTGAATRLDLGPAGTG